MIPVKMPAATVNVISLVSVSRAFFISPEPSICPTIIPTELPRAIKMTENRLKIVEEILVAATTSSPLIE